MIYLVTFAGFVTLCVAVFLAYAAWPDRGLDGPDVDEQTAAWLAALSSEAALEPLPALALRERPADADRLLTVALSAARHPCYQYAARLAAMSWQSHKTLQRNYDVLAFATVFNALQRSGYSYA